VLLWLSLGFRYPLWYADWDGEQSFSDGAYHFGGSLSPLGCTHQLAGWSSPAMKQYADSGPCTNVDVSWYACTCYSPGSVVSGRYPSSLDFFSAINATKQVTLSLHMFFSNIVSQELIDLDELNRFFNTTAVSFL
jgi:hypothetical protein